MSQPLQFSRRAFIAAATAAPAIVLTSGCQGGNNRTFDGAAPVVTPMTPVPRPSSRR